jgi:GNAT superfamily N-acetyltransferase
MSPTNDQIIVRAAHINDVPRLCELLLLLFTQEADFQPDIAKQSRALRLIIEQPEMGRILCAVEGDAIIGMISLLYTISTAEGGRAAWVEDLIVQPTRRGQGIGEQLLQAIISEGRATGCLRLTLLTDGDNAKAQHLYTRAGFVRSQMVPMRFKL